MVAKRFFHVCAGLLMLAIAYALGVRAAGAQAGFAFAAFAVDGSHAYILQDNGDVWARYYAGGAPVVFQGAPIYLGNMWAGGVTPAQSRTFGQVKARFAGQAQRAARDGR